MNFPMYRPVGAFGTLQENSPDIKIQSSTDKKAINNYAEDPFVNESKSFSLIYLQMIRDQT